MDEMDFTEFAKDFVLTKIPPGVLNGTLKHFYDLMRRHGIKHGMKQADGSIRVANFAWTFCWDAFSTALTKELNFKMMCNIPKDLRC